MLRTILVSTVFLAASAAPAYAQLDPLLFLKDQAPFILFAVDTSNRMLRDAPSDPATLATSRATSFYYDPVEYTKTGLGWEASLGVDNLANNTKYRRKYYGLNYLNNNATTTSIRVVTANNTTVDVSNGPTVSPAGIATYSLVDAPTRLALTRAAIYQAITMNLQDMQFGFLKMRQKTPITAASAAAATTPINIAVTAPANTNQTTTTENGASTWKLQRPTVTQSNGSQNSAPNPLYVKDGAKTLQPTSATSNEDIQTFLAKSMSGGGLIPAGSESAAADVDAPVKYLLDDARAAADTLIDDEADCTNTIVVLIVGGGEGTTVGGVASPIAAGTATATTASTFLNVRSRRVPIYVIAIAPPTTDVAGLKLIATNSGGQYFEITKAQIDAALVSTDADLAAGKTPMYPSAIAGTVVVPEFVSAINTAVQHGLADFADVNTAPTNALPFGPTSEFQVASPVIGSVNLDDAKDITGAALPNTKVLDKAGNVIPQRSNVIMTTGFTLPGANASLKAFRQYKPVADVTQSSGYKFSADGTRLWVAKVPDDRTKRNLFTAKADGTIIPFDTLDVPAGNLAILAGLMNLSVADATAVITAVRNAPLGSIVDSTPAIMNPPSLDPPPDDDYPAFAVANKSRRSIVWVGTNAGILEGLDARLGIEAWGFIPLNLLPKLKVTRLGQGLTTFEYFVDGSAKIADVKIDGTWRTHLIMGEGAGGTFFQSFDVTMAGMTDVALLTPVDDDMNHVLAYFSDSTRITFNWAFPRYSSFDPTLNVFEGNLNATVQFGDLKATATAAEKTVGQTWSDPAVGQMVNASGPFTVLIGSGFLPYTTQQQANRGGTIAGTTFYVLSAKDGTVYDTKDVGNDGQNENIDNCSAHVRLVDEGDGKGEHRGKKKKLYGCNKIKNALQSDPVGTGPSDSRFITKAYMGDLDGRVWRFDMNLDGTTHLPKVTALTKLFESGDDQPIFSSMATVNVGGTNQYIFFATGSDLLPSVDVSTKYHLLGVLDDGATSTKTFDQSLDKTNDKGKDEKVTAFPAVAGDIVFFTTTTFQPKNACKSQNANLYALTFIGGPAYDSNGDNKVDKHDKTLVKTIAGERATAPFIVDQHLVFGTASKVAVFGDPTDFNNGVGQAGVRVLSWREVR